ncbi:squalene synthase HpnC [Verticiella sediminum]|uniref:Squalene synthase HpnC n=2 Tax=Verticiella sediminum TaxID=1247510 RepID=A0A556AD20_9BURK|nr:squalene synthase HpnC [Verticiella sediminum]TSH90768.1 squalene synthase HpnC [Verticiella sediminum]
MPVDHYENFPVASLLLPSRLREAVQHIYRYARTADDIADEGDAPPAERLAALAGYRAGLAAIEHDAALPETAPAAVFEPLRTVVRAFRLPIEPFARLLTAFEQDVTQHRYADEAALLQYCRHSADPVGELMLRLYDAADAHNLHDSDAICTGLQLVNFCQDVAIDLAKGRVYVPQDELRAAGLADAGLRGQTGTAAWRRLMARQLERAREHLLRGAPLATRLPGRIGWELRLVVCGGLRILDRIEAADYDVFHARPTLGRRDWLAIGGRALTYRRVAPAQPATP